MKLTLLIATTLTLLTCAPREFTPDKNMKQIDDKTAQLNLKVGEEAYYQAKVHGSVGIQVEIEIENRDVINISREQFDYKNPDRAEMPGGDEAKRTLVLKGINPGKTKVIIKSVYRGEVTKEQIIHCSIAE